MTTSNKQIRSNIMEILDNNSKNIPDGVYLELCNELQKFNFVDNDEDKIIEEANRIIMARRNARNVEAAEYHERMYVINPETGRQVYRNGRIGRRLTREE